MYNFPHQSFLHHNIHNDYQRYSDFDEKTLQSNNQSRTDYDTGIQQNNVPQLSESQILSKDIILEPVAEKKASSKIGKKGPVDTSNFTVEERLVAAVWVHERKNTKCSIGQIKQDFRQRFGREPPAKNTLLVWERKLFSTGNVHDAPRPGRPINRAGAAAALASVARAPALSLRARARALRMPRTTLRAILARDLAHSPNSAERETPGKRTAKPTSAKSPPRPPPRGTRPASSQHYFQGYT